MTEYEFEVPTNNTWDELDSKEILLVDSRLAHTNYIGRFK